MTTLLTLVLVLGACSAGSPGASAGEPEPGGDPSQAGESDAAGQPTPGTSLTACEIVTAADIEAALTLEPGTVAAGTLEVRPTPLDPAVNECRYEGEAWGGLIVHVTPTDGVNTFDAVESTFGDEAEPLDIGDGALWFEDDDRGYFLKGAVMFFLQFTFIADQSPLREPTIALGEAGIGRL